MTREELTTIIKASVEDVWYNRRSLNPIKEQTELLVEKLYPLLDNPLPPAEGAEEILSPLCERDDAEDFLATKDIWNHPRISDRTDNESYEVADLMAEFAGQFAALHAQKIADKMVGEKDDDVFDKMNCLIGYLERWLNNPQSNNPPAELRMVIDEAIEYLKTREK